MKCIHRGDIRHAPAWAGEVIEVADPDRKTTRRIGPSTSIPITKASMRPLPSWEEIIAGLKKAARGTGPTAEMAKKALADVAAKKEKTR